MASENNNTKAIRWLARARNTNHYFTFYRPYYHVMRKLTALMFQDLINLACLNVTDWKDGWFRCTGNYLAGFGWTEKEQRTNFANLVRAGFVKTEKRGIPPQRWVFVDVAAVETALDTAENERIKVRQSDEKGVIDGAEKPARKKTTSSQEEKNTVAQPTPRATPATPGCGNGDGRPTSLPGDSMLPPLVDMPAQVTAEQSPELEALVARLQSALAAWHKPPGRRGGWHTHLARLIRTRGVTLARLTKVVNWYADHLRDKYCPLAWSARAFQTKFDNIEAAMARHEERNPTVEIGPATRSAAKRLDMLGWPKGSDKDVTTVTQVCVDRIKFFLNKLRKPQNCGGGLARFIPAFADYVANQLSPPHEVAEDHMRQVNRRVNRWPDWSGNLLSLAWSADSDDFKRQLRGWAEQRFGDAALADKLLKEIGNG